MSDTKDYVDREMCLHQMCEQQRAWNQRFEDAGMAITLAKDNIDHRLKDIDKLQDAFNRLQVRLEITEAWKNEMVGRMWLVGGFLFTLQVAIAVYVFVYMHK